MAFNLYGEPIPDIVTEKPAVELPQRADGRACNIYGEPIEDAETVAAKNQQLPPTPTHVQVVQGAVDATLPVVGKIALTAFIEGTSQASRDIDAYLGLGNMHEDDDLNIVGFFDNE